jgi:hypothetical protein
LRGIRANEESFMQTVYRARNLADARSACTALAAVGIPAHIADQELWEIAGLRQDADVIRVLVDNRRLDKARRALLAWSPAQTTGLVPESAGNFT